MIRNLNIFRRINFKRNFCSKEPPPTPPPEKPSEVPEEPTTCCQSGCANCVWIEYATKLTEVFQDEGEKAQKLILDKISDPALKAFLEMELRSAVKAAAAKNKNEEENSNKKVP